MTTTRRRAPLRADVVDPDMSTVPGIAEAPELEPAADVPPTQPVMADIEISSSLATRERTSDDRRRFADAVRSLRTGGGSRAFSERTLMVVGGVIAPLGLLFVLLGWVGASRTPNLFEQIPYMISGGMFGLGLVFLGAFFYFAHWITELVKENRAQSADLLAAIERLRNEMSGSWSGALVGSSPSEHDGGTPLLVATARGSMVHRPECVVVAGKDDVHVVDHIGSLTACRMCDPLLSEPTDHDD